MLIFIPATKYLPDSFAAGKWSRNLLQKCASGKTEFYNQEARVETVAGFPRARELAGMVVNTTVPAPMTE